MEIFNWIKIKLLKLDQAISSMSVPDALYVSLFLIFIAGIIVGAALVYFPPRLRQYQQQKHKVRAPAPTQSGSILFALYAAVGTAAVLGGVMITTMKGPVRSMHNVTQRTIAENNMIAAGKLAIMATADQPDNGDCDGDNTVEPIAWSNTGTGPKPTGGGYLPANIGAALTDPWGNAYGYCVWDHGSEIQTTCPTPAQRLKGAANAVGPVIAIISSGADWIFQTSCGDAPVYVVKAPGSDDVVMTYSYGEAKAMAMVAGAGTGGLWTLQPVDDKIAEIAKNIEVKNQGGNVVFGVDSTTDINKPSIKVDYIKALNNAKIEALTVFLGSVGIEGATASQNSRGVYGLASATIGANYGVYGESKSAGGAGVYGESPNIGVHGITNHSFGRGVQGANLNASGTGSGVYGYTLSTGGGAAGVNGRADMGSNYGVLGTASFIGVAGSGIGTTGHSVGVSGESKSTSGRGVDGKATASTGTTYGVYGESKSTSGTGVRGEALAFSGLTYGGYFQSAGTSGMGVYGRAASPTGTTVGVYGEAASTSGYGVYSNGRAHVQGNLSVSGTATVAAPVNANDAATKAYVDAAAGGGISATTTVNGAISTMANYTTLNSIAMCPAGYFRTGCSAVRGSSLSPNVAPSGTNACSCTDFSNQGGYCIAYCTK